jgi:hypothetical protein
MDISVIVVASHSFYCSQIMARLGIEPRLPKYVSGALPLSYLAIEY